MEQAIKDLQFLSKRLKGIVELGPELENLTSLKQLEKEYTSSIEALKGDKEKLITEIEGLKKETFNISDTVNEKLSKASEEASNIIKEANLKADSISKNAYLQYSEEVKAYEDKIKELSSVSISKEDSIKLLNKEISILEDKKASLIKDLENIKSKI